MAGTPEVVDQQAPDTLPADFDFKKKQQTAAVPTPVAAAPVAPTPSAPDTLPADFNFKTSKQSKPAVVSAAGKTPAVKAPVAPQEDLLTEADKHPYGLTPEQTLTVKAARAARGLYHGLMGDEESDKSKGPTSTASPVAENLGFTPEHLGYKVGEMAHGVGKFVYEAGKDLLGNEPVMIPDALEGKPNASFWDRVKSVGDPKVYTLMAKYVNAPSYEERQAYQDEMQKYFESHGGVEASGHAISAFLHGTLGEYVPMIGPLAMSIEKQAQEGDLGGALAQVASLYALEKGTGKLKAGIKERVNAKIQDLTKTPEVKTAEENLQAMKQPLADAQAKYAEAKAAADKYSASAAQGIKPPKPIDSALIKAKAELDEAQAHHDLAAEHLERMKAQQPSVPQQVGGAVGRMIGKVLPKGTPVEEVPAEKIEAKLASQAPKAEEPPVLSQYGKPPVEHATTTIPQEPTEAPRASYGRIALANDQGTMGKPLMLTEGKPEVGMPKLEVPPEEPKPAPEAPKVGTAADLKSLKAKDGKVIDTDDTIEGRVQKLLEQALKPEEPKATPAPEAPKAEAPVEHREGERRVSEEPYEGEERRHAERRVLNDMTQRMVQEGITGKSTESRIDTDAYAAAMQQARAELGKDADLKTQVIPRRNEILRERGIEAPKGDTGSEVRKANPEPTRAETKGKPVLPKEEPIGYTPKKEEVLPVGTEGREPAKSGAEYVPAIQQKVSELGEENLRKLAKAHGLNPDEYVLNKADEKRLGRPERDERRHRVERDQLAKDIVEQMGEDEKVNLGRAAEATERQGTFAGADVSAKGRAERAAKMFPRLRGPVDEYGNPKIGGGSQDADEKGEKAPDWTAEQWEERRRAEQDEKLRAAFKAQHIDEDTGFAHQAQAKLGPNASLSDVLQEAAKMKKSEFSPEKKAELVQISEANKSAEPTVNPRPAIPRAPLDPEKIAGGDKATPHNTYHEASQVKGNPWVRRSADPLNDSMPTNEKRTLLVQFSSDLINKDILNDESTAYYDELYSGAREGYDRMKDFWETPQWMGFASHFIPDADVYVVRDMAQAKEFLKSAKYGNVMFSALDVNQGFIKELAADYDGKFDVGGYVQPDALKALPNVTWHDSMKAMAEAKGFEYKNGVDYRHFYGSDVIPRLTLSDGCLHKCAFCIVPKEIKMTPDDVAIQQAEEIGKMGSKLVYINDKTFGQASNYKTLADLNARIKKINPDFKGFVVQTTAAQMGKLTPEFLKESGIKYVELGIESWNDEILKEMKKPANERLIDKAFAKLHDAGIAVIPNLIVGLPGETAETLAHTLDEIKAHRQDISHLNVYNLAWYKDSALGQSATVAAEDLNENVLNLKRYTNPEMHQKFAGDLYSLGSELLKENKENAPKDVPKYIANAHNKHSGFTFNPSEGLVRDKAVFSVAGEHPELDATFRGRKITPADVKTYMERPDVKAVLDADPRNSIGGWVYKGNSHLEISKLFHDKAEAVAQGIKLNQNEIYDHAKREPIPTGGSAAEDLHKAEFEKRNNKQGEPMTYTHSGDQYTVTTNDASGKKIGESVVKDIGNGTAEVLSNQIYDKKLQKKGRGSEQMKELLYKLPDDIKTVKSDISTTDAARGAWEKILKYAPEAVTKSSYKDGQVQYTVDMAKWRGEHLPTVSGEAQGAGVARALKAIEDRSNVLKPGKVTVEDLNSADKRHFLLADGSMVSENVPIHADIENKVGKNNLEAAKAIRMAGPAEFDVHSEPTPQQMRELGRILKDYRKDYQYGKIYWSIDTPEYIENNVIHRSMEVGGAGTFEDFQRDVAKTFKPASAEPKSIAKMTVEDLQAKLPELAQKHLTEEEKAGITTTATGKPRTAGTEKFISNMEKVPEVQEYVDIALQGEGARKWYSRSSAAFDAMTKEAPDYFKEGDKEKFLGLLAASSPQQSVAMNLREALGFWKEWNDAGRPEFSLDKWREFGEAADAAWKEDGSPRVGGNKKGASMHWDYAPTGTKWKAENLLLKNLTLPDTKVPNVIKALNGEELWPDLTKNQAFKAPSFYENLRKWASGKSTGTKNVTNDSWMGLFGGIDKSALSKPENYHPLSVVTRAAAEELGWEPEEAQAAIWSFTQALTEKGVEDPELIRHYSEDFKDLMANDLQTRDLLSDLGVNLDDLDKRLEAIGEKPKISGRSTPTTADSVRKLKTRIEEARGKGAIPEPKSIQGNLFRENPSFEHRTNPGAGHHRSVVDAATRFEPSEFETGESELSNLGEKKKKSRYGKLE